MKWFMFPTQFQNLKHHRLSVKQLKSVLSHMSHRIVEE